MDNLEDIKIQILNLEKLNLQKFNELDKKIDLLNENNNKKIDEIKVECTKM